MKNLFKLFAFLFTAIVVLSSCSDDNDNELYPSELTKGAYILNYGGYSQNTSSITKYDYETQTLTAFYYQLQNGGNKIGSAPQYIYKYENRLYLMNNNPDRVLVVDPLFVAQDTITTDIIKPRYCVGYGDYLYISCWGGDVWTDASVSYLVKYNVATKKVEKKISMPGGPEGLAIANGKLYAALGYAKKIAVMDLNTEAISYITTEAVSSYFAKDKSGNLYVTFISSYSNPSTQTGLGYINTSTNTLTLYSLSNVSTSYSSILSFSKDYSKLYVVAAAYDASWNLVGGVQIFNTSTKMFETTPLVSGVTGINGVSVNPVDGDVYVFVSKGSTTNGNMMVYSAGGEYESTLTVGASPAMAIFLD